MSTTEQSIFLQVVAKKNRMCCELWEAQRDRGSFNAGIDKDTPRDGANEVVQPFVPKKPFCEWSNEEWNEFIARREPTSDADS